MWRIWTAALLWGLNWPAVKIMLTAIPPWTLRAAGLSAGAVLLIAFARLTGRRLAIPIAQWRHVAIAGLLNVAGFNIFAVFAQLSMPTSRAAILTFTMPLWAALFSWLALGEKIDNRRGVALGVGAIGLVALSLPFLDVMRAGNVPVGLAYVLGAAISWAAGTVYLKAHPIATEPLVLTAWQVVVAAVVCTAGMLAFEPPIPVWQSRTLAPAVAMAFVYHAIFPQAVAYVLWFSFIRSVSAGSATLGTLLVPVFGVVGAVVLLDDWPAATDIAGLALLLAAVVLDQIARPPAPVRSS